MKTDCTEGGWIWWCRNVLQHCKENNVEPKSMKELFEAYISGKKWEDVVEPRCECGRRRQAQCVSGGKMCLKEDE